LSLDLERLETLKKEIVAARVELRTATRLEDYDAAYLATAEVEALRAEVRQIQEKTQLDSVPELDLPPEVIEAPLTGTSSTSVDVLESGIEESSVELDVTPDTTDADVKALIEDSPEPEIAEDVADTESAVSAFSFMQDDSEADSEADSEVAAQPTHVLSTEGKHGEDDESSMFSRLATDADESAPDPPYSGVSADGPNADKEQSEVAESQPEPQVNDNSARKADLNERIDELTRNKSVLDALLEQKCAEEDYEAAGVFPLNLPLYWFRN
jgi:hypothetical protein